MKLNPESLAKASSHHPWRTVIVWVLVLFAAGASAATLLGPALTTDFDFTNSPEAKQADQILQERRLHPGHDHRDVHRHRRAGRGGEPRLRRRGQHVPHRPERAGPRCLPSAPGSVPADRGAGRRSTGGGTRPDPVGGRVGRAVHGDLHRRPRRCDHALRGRRCDPRTGLRGHRHRRGPHARPGELLGGLQGHLRGGPAVRRVDRHRRRDRGAADRVRGDRRRLPAAAPHGLLHVADHAGHRRAVRHAVGLQLLHPEPDLHDGHRRRGGLRPVHRVAIPRGAAQRPREERCDPRVRRHGVTRGVLQRLDRRPGAGGHAPGARRRSSGASPAARSSWSWCRWRCR